MNSKAVIEYIVNWARGYSQDFRYRWFCSGCVWGHRFLQVTSSLMALTNKPVMCIEMPIHQHKNEMKRAREHIEQLKRRFLNVSSYLVDITSVYDNLKKFIT